MMLYCQTAWKDGAKFMMDPATSYFLRKYYPHVIKWYLVVYNPEFFRIWPSKAEETAALKIEAKAEKLLPALEVNHTEALVNSGVQAHSNDISVSAFNATTGSYSGLYGQKPIDEETQAALNTIMNISSNQSNIDYLLSGGEPKSRAAYIVTNEVAAEYIKNSDVIIPPEQDEIIKEANAIYERLLQEALEDEAKKQAEIELARQQYEYAT